MKKFWKRPDGNDEEAEKEFERREKIALGCSLVIFFFILFVIFPMISKSTDEYWRREAMRSYDPNYNPRHSAFIDSIPSHPFKETE